VSNDSIPLEVRYIYDKLVNPVILPIPIGEKGPVFKGWNKMTYEQTQAEEYQKWIEMAVARGGNLGILLGPPSGGLVAIDFDDDMEVEEFLRWSPWAERTLRTRGCKGCQMWFYCDGDYPARRIVLKDVEGRPTVEFRGGGGQSVVWGLHPKGMRYKVVVDAVPLHIEYVDLATWMAGFRGRVDDDEWRNGQSGDWSWLKRYKGSDIRELDLLGLLNEAGVGYRKITEEKYAIKCPWADRHTTGNGSLDAVCWQYKPRGKWFPAFNCLHAHCQSRSLEDLVEWLEARCMGGVARHCKRVNPAGRVQLIAYAISVDKIEEEPILPRQLIEDVLYEKTKMMISGPPKIRKSWGAMDMALSLSLGEPWMGFDTCQTRVCFLNMEMPKEFFDWRMYIIQQARKIRSMPKDGFVVLNLRGSYALDEDWNELAKFCMDYGPFGAVFIDPIYKVLGERDENSAKDMANLLRNVDMVSNTSGAAMIEVHHFAKGSYEGKDVGDRASGSGVFYRDADEFLTIGYADPKIKIYNEGRIDIRARLQKPLEPIGVRWNSFRWQRDDNITFEKKSKNEGTPVAKQVTQADILVDIIKESSTGITYMELFRRSGFIKSSFDSALKAVKARGKVQVVGDLYIYK
jgi:hypothetical protein